MFRALGMLGMGAAFLSISPKLRMTVYGGIEAGVTSMEVNAPYSYIGAGVAILIIGGIVLCQGSQAR
jgi:hypothetical protein